MTFTVEQALKAQQALRDSVALPPERFPLPAFIGMLSDEIESLRTAGKTDAEITALINDAAGTKLSVSEITENFASLEERGRG